MTKFFLEIVYIIGYNLKNARNGKSASKISQGQDSGPWDLKKSLYHSLNFQKIQRICMQNAAGEPGPGLQQLFPFKSSYPLKVQSVIKSHSLSMGVSNSAILIFSTCFFRLLRFSP